MAQGKFAELSQPVSVGQALSLSAPHSQWGVPFNNMFDPSCSSIEKFQHDKTPERSIPGDPWGIPLQDSNTRRAGQSAE